MWSKSLLNYQVPKPPDHHRTAPDIPIDPQSEQVDVLTIKCSGCKCKLWKYKKIGSGKVLRCHKDRIGKRFDVQERDGMLICPCGRVIASDMGRYYKMHSESFSHTGTKDTA